MKGEEYGPDERNVAAGIEKEEREEEPSSLPGHSEVRVLRKKKKKYSMIHD